MRFTISKRTYQIAMWTLCSLSILFLASRFAVRVWKKGRLRKSDYFLILALPSLLTAAGLLHSCLGLLYTELPGDNLAAQLALRGQSDIAPRLTAAIELLWVSIYSVKASFFAQFKFYKPPYSYVSPHLTRYYWTAICMCGLAFAFTLIVVTVLCPNANGCRYFALHNTIVWETVLTVLDIVIDLQVISIPIWLITMANFDLTRAAINTSFKALSVFTVAIAGCRLAFQYNADNHRVDYVSLTFWLVVEAVVAIIVASISSYRIVLLDYLSNDRTEHHPSPAGPKVRHMVNAWKSKCQRAAATITTITSPVPLTRLNSQSDLSLQQGVRPSSSLSRGT